jgi:hypothetical protein
VSALSIINPATEPVATVDMLDLEAADRAIERAQSAAPRWRAVAPRGPGASSATLRRRRRRHNEELAQLEVANSGHTIANARWEAGNVRDVLAYYSGAPERHSGRQIPVAGGRRPHLLRTVGRRGHHRPVELPHADRRVGSRPGARGGQHRGLKARDADAAHGDAARRTRPRGRLPEGVFQVLPGDGGDRGLPIRHARGRAQGLLHRFERDGPKDHGRLRRTGQARDAWSWAARAPTSSSPTPTSNGRGQRALRGL